jgi:hypothetical protein
MKQQVTDRRRNDEVTQRDRHDRDLMVAPSPLNDVFNELVEGPNDDFKPPLGYYK